MSLMLIRHGDTDLEGSFHGWIDIPLNEKGMRQVENTAQSLRGLKAFKLITDDFMRATQTAQAIGVVLQLPVCLLPAIRPWNTGDLAGKPYDYTVVLPYVNDPKKRVPGGECLQTFIDRNLPCIKPMIAAKELFVVIGHASTANLVQSLYQSKGKTFNWDAFRTESPIKHAEVITVSPDWKTEILIPKTPYLKDPKKADKASVLYMHVEGTRYQCKDCVTFIPKEERCFQHGKSDVIKPYGGCGLFAYGTPVPGLTPQGSVTKEQSGYVESKDGFTCSRCEYFLAPRRDCQRVDPNSPGDDPREIHPQACCNAWEDA